MRSLHDGRVLRSIVRLPMHGGSESNFQSGPSPAPVSLSIFPEPKAARGCLLLTVLALGGSLRIVMAAFNNYASRLSLSYCRQSNPDMPALAQLVQKSQKISHSRRLSTGIQNLASCLCTADRSNLLDENAFNRSQSSHTSPILSSHARGRRLSVKSQAVASAPMSATESRPSSSIRKIQVGDVCLSCRIF